MIDTRPTIQTAGQERQAEPAEPLELQSLAHVILRCLGMVRIHWDAVKLPAAHPYRQAAAMLESYLRRRS